LLKNKRTRGKKTVKKKKGIVPGLTTRESFPQGEANFRRHTPRILNPKVGTGKRGKHKYRHKRKEKRTLPAANNKDNFQRAGLKKTWFMGTIQPSVVKSNPLGKRIEKLS